MDAQDVSARPSDAEFEELVAKAHRRIHGAMRRRGSGRVRRFVIGGLAALVIAGGGAAVAAASGLLGGVEATSTRTADFELGPAPTGSTFVHVTVEVTCQPGAYYKIDLDHARNPASLHCGKDDDQVPSQLGYEFELIDRGPDHSVTVSTNVERTYKVQAHYRTGLTRAQKTDARMDRLEAQREENARTVRRTDKAPSSDPFNHPAAWPDPYYVNENGMTIGTFDRDTTPYDQWPDLMPLRGPNGEEAFTYSGKRGHVVESPEEAVEYMRWLVRTGQSDPIKSGRWAKMYLVHLAKDGTTIIARSPDGSFKQE